MNPGLAVSDYFQSIGSTENHFCELTYISFDGHGGRCGSTNDTRLNSAEIPVARNCFANEGQVVRKPNSGSARHRWARENSKHRRTATRQRGFCSSVLQQYPLDLLKPRVPQEHWLLKIVCKASALRAPRESTELPKSTVFRPFCQRLARGSVFKRARLQPAVGIQGRHMNLGRRNHQQSLLRVVRQGINFV